jgi:hypothetical protein
MNPTKLTPAQLSIKKMADRLIQEVGRPFTGSDWPTLIDGLQQVQPTTIWGTVIKWAMREGHDMSQLVGELASQAGDDPMTMMTIVGPDTTILLLRYLKR